MKEGWTYKKLGEIALDMYRGSGIKRDQVTPIGFPCVRYGEIYTTYNYAFEECVSHTNEEFIASPKYFSHGDLLFAITGESVEDIGKTIAYLGNEKCLLGGDIVCMKHEQNPKYLAYALSSREAIRQKGFGKTKLKVVHTNIPALSEIKIPIAPLDEQKRIVERLDAAFENIDKLKANAEKQLAEARTLFQKSLAKAMEPKEGWEEKKLGEICSFSQGVQVPLNNQSLVKLGGYTRFLRIIDYTQGNEPPRYVPINDAKYWMNHEDIAIVRYGASTGFICTGLEGTLANNLFRLNIKHNVVQQFLIYVLKSDIFQSVIKVQMNGAAMPAISFGLIDGIIIPLPPLAEQQRIVERLDALSENIRKYEEIQRQIISECDALKQALLRKVFE